MVSIYTPEATNMLKEYLSGKKATTSGLHRLLDRESIKEVSSPDQSDLSYKVLSWFSSLSTEERQSAVTIHDLSLADFTRQMYHKRQMMGNFKMTYKSPCQFSLVPTAGLPSEAEFLQWLRLKDTEDYLDTLTIDRLMLKRPGKLVHLMRKLNEFAFKLPLKLSASDPVSTPTAFLSASASLAELLSLAFEQQVWDKFWTWQQKLRPSAIRNWNQFDTQRRLEVVGDIQSWQEEYRQICKRAKKFQVAPKLPPKRQGSLITIYKNIEQFSGDQIVDFLSLSSLDRAGTPLDIIARKILHRIKSTQKRSNSSATSTSTSSREDLSFIREIVLELIAAQFFVPKQETVVDSEFPPLAPSPKQVTFTRLHREMENFVKENNRQIARRAGVVDEVLSQVKLIVQSLFPGSSLTLFGSYASDIALDTSDIDLQIKYPICQSRQSIQMACQCLYWHLQLYPWVADLQCIENASIPVVKVQVNLQNFTGEGWIDIDLTFDDSQGSGLHLGVISLHKSKELLKEYPSAKVLMIVLKKLLGLHALNYSYKGGVNSYSLLIWVVTFLRTLKNVPIDYGELLEAFLKFWEEKGKTGIGIDIDKGVFEVEHCPGVLTVDPTRNNNNTTRCSYNADSVFKLFANTHRLICGRKNTKHLLSEVFTRNY